MAEFDILLDGVSKFYGAVTAVDNIHLPIERGAYCCLLGPSGCGKTSTLRMIAGHEPISAGKILIRQQDVTHRPPARRNTAMMFQGYALFPHMTLIDNVAFGLKMRGVGKGDHRKQAEAIFDAFILACWGDPGIEAAREITCKPVVGIAEASLYVANSLGAKFGVVSTLKRTQHMVEKTIEKVGLSSHCALALCTDLPVAATAEDRDLTLNVLESGARTVIAAGAEVIVLGCAGMSGLDELLAARLGVPVIDSVAAAVVWAEALVQLGKSTSKANTYRPPEIKPITGYPAYMQPENLSHRPRIRLEIRD